MLVFCTNLFFTGSQSTGSNGHLEMQFQTTLNCIFGMFIIKIFHITNENIIGKKCFVL